MIEANHIAIILDGNRRWAKKKGMAPQLGHKQGAQTLETVAKQAAKKGLKYLTVYIFSTENWNRSKEEVDYLMRLFRIYFAKLIKNSAKHNIRVKFLGTQERLTEELKRLELESENKTKDKDGMQLNLCFNYGGRKEIIEAVKKIADKVKKGELSLEQIDEKIVEDNLYSKDIPDPDILIRTSGEQRLSNFLPWQLTYTEFFFIQKDWPDFNIEDLERIDEEFSKRNRRFGAG